MTTKEIKNWYEEQIEWYKKQTEWSNKEIEWLNSQIKWEKDYYEFETLRCKEYKSKRAKEYRNRKKYAKEIAYYEKELLELLEDFPELNETKEEEKTEYVVFYYGLLVGKNTETHFDMVTDRQTAKAIYRHFEKNSIYVIESGVFNKNTRMDVSNQFNYL